MTSDEIFHNNENISKRNTDERGRKFSEKGGKGNNMLKYILKRILYIIPVMFGVIVLVFIMKTVTPGDPVASLLPGTATEEMKNNLREQLGLNDPVLKQFGSYVLGVVQGDLGTSYKTRQPVAQEIAMRLPNTITIAIWAMFIAQIIATPLGILAAVKQNSVADSFIVVFTMIGASVPGFWLALMLIQWFAIDLHWVPSMYDGSLKSWILPIVSITFGSVAATTRGVRTNMLEVIRQDYIKTARAKGQKETIVIWKHAFRNTLIPVIAGIGGGLEGMMGGAVVTEQVFAVPGVGKYIADAVSARNFPSLQGGIIVIALICCVINIIVDVGYTVADPRLKTTLMKSSVKKTKAAKGVA